MILSGKEILLNIGNEIKIDPFDKKKINPNSYNLSLHDELVVYDMRPLDMKKNNKTKNIKIPDRGLVLKPGRLYLGRTIEHTETHNLVPMIEGRSSVGRLGIFVHITAGFGDVGFKGFWTLEISCIEPVRIYPDVEICQIFYHTILGQYNEYKSDKYQGNDGIQASQMFQELI